ncbi:MAG: serine/threonine protein kinase [Solirubrobacterales bacterium]|nr:serine/threonine protein kinase [Solirubrobacterales bacterium]
MRASHVRSTDGAEALTRRAAQVPTGSPAARRAGPTVLGRYRLIRRLGAGGFGVVWEAHDERLEREVAVKVLPRERVVGGRFEREARAAARLAHPGIVTLYEAAVDDEGAYLVSELVRGDTLAAWLAEGRLSDRDIVAIGIALCDALEHAHAQGVVHRDVKPSNILVPARAATPAQAAKLTDFGVARVVGGDSLTRTGDVIGTMAYMAPEQAEGREVGDVADLYSTALVLYEALTGVNPVLSGTVAVRARRLGAYLPPLRRQRRELPRELGHAIDLALRPRPRERGTLPELRAGLAASLELVGDRPGVVSGPWPAATRVREEVLAGLAEPSSQGQSDRRSPALPGSDSAGSGRGLLAARPLVAEWPARALGAAASAALMGWVAAHLLSPVPLASGALALLAGLLVLALPRLGWLGVVLGAGAIAAAQGSPGLTVVLVAFGLFPVALAPLSRDLPCALPALCPALGVIGLAGAWPGMVVHAGTAWRRATLAATGWLWLLIAASLTGRSLYLRIEPPLPSAKAWSSSLSVTAHQVLAPLLSPGLLAPAAVWAAGAAILPLLRPRRFSALDAIVVLAWAVAVAVGTALALHAGGRGHGAVLTGQGFLGALGAAVAVIVPRRARGRRPGGRSANPAAELA